MRAATTLHLVCDRVQCASCLLDADEGCCGAELRCGAECYMLKAASENVSVLILTSLVSSCPNAAVVVAEDAGDFLFAERGG